MFLSPKKSHPSDGEAVMKTTPGDVEVRAEESPDRWIDFRKPDTQSVPIAPLPRGSFYR